MNKKTIVTGFLTAVIASSLILTTSVSAFWPFDGLFSKGSVKAAVTDIKTKIGINNTGGKAVNPAIMAERNEDVVLRNLKIMTVACNEIAGKQIQLDQTTRQTYMAKNTGNKMENTRAIKAVETDYKEMNSVATQLKAKCAEIIKLNTRFTKVAPAEQTCGGRTGKLCSEGYTCNYGNGNVNAKMTPDAMGKCVKSVSEGKVTTPPTTEKEIPPIRIGRVRCDVSSSMSNNGCPEFTKCQAVTTGALEGYCVSN
jgi:hypothetical protein